MSKIAFLGAASHVFGPSMIKHALVENRLDGLELALVDVDSQGLEIMAAIAATTAAKEGLALKVTTHTQREGALRGADFVLSSVAVEGLRRYAMDCEVIARLAPGHQVSEFGGVAGISYSLRQIALIEQLAADMRRLCPKAWLLTVSNPLPRVCQAAEQLGIKTAGFCSVSSGILGLAGEVLGPGRERYPWPAARQRWEFRAAGVNHFSWLLEFRSRSDGADLLGELVGRIVATRAEAEPQRVALIRETGYCPLPGQDHLRDFLRPPGPQAAPPEVFHGDSAERQRRRQWLRDVGAGKEPLADLPEESWERPMDVVASMLDGRRRWFNSINLVNAGQVPSLPRGVFVETPCEAGPDGPEPLTMELPEAVVGYARHTAAVSDKIVQAALSRSRGLLAEAAELDPTIVDKAAGLRALNECLAIHSDLLPEYS
jgi:alpha-galactosidase